MESARPDDVIALHEVVARESGMEMLYVDPFFACLAEGKIIEGLWRLSLPQLQNLAAMLCSTGDQMAA